MSRLPKIPDTIIPSDFGDRIRASVLALKGEGITDAEILYATNIYDDVIGKAMLCGNLNAHHIYKSLAVMLAHGVLGTEESGGAA